MVGIRNGIREDLPRLFELIKELAIYENGLHEVNNDLDMMDVDGFGKNSVFQFLVAEDDSEILGASIYYYRYSTWKGRRLYLEDLIVTEQSRGKGIGKLLLDATINVAKEANCTGMMWQVLDWNTPAIAFYKKYGVQFDGGWLNCNLDF